MDQFIDEVNEDLKKEKYEEVWKKYGNYVIGAAVVVLLATAGYSFWKNWTEEKAASDGAAFEAAILSIEGKALDDASAKLEGFRADAGDGYRGLAMIRQAQILQEKGDLDGALAVWEAVAADSALGKVYQEFGLLMSVVVGSGNMDLSAIQGRLEPIAQSTSGWRHLALEQIALAAIAAGELDQARDVLDGLAADSQVPQGLQQRVGNYLAVLSAN